MLELRVLDGVRAVPEAAWNALVGEGAAPFADWRWLAALEETGCVAPGRGWLPRPLALYRGNDLVAACPLYVKGNSEGEFVFDWAWADASERMGQPYYPKLVVGIPFTPATGPRVLLAPGEDLGTTVALFAEGARRFADAIDASGIHVLFPPEDEVRFWLDADQGFLHRLGSQYHWTNHAYASWEEYLARFNAKRRHQIRREWSEVEKRGIRIATLGPDELTPSMVETMFRFYASTVDKFHWGRRYLTLPFFQRVAQTFADRLAWVVARDPRGAPIAGAFNVRGGNRLYGRYWGATEEVPFLHFDVCYYHGIRDAIAQGLEAFEPGAGGEHKHPRGFLPTLTHSAHWLRHPRLAGAVAAFLDQERDAVRRRVAASEDP